MSFDVVETRRFLGALTGDPNTKVTWQTFADSPALKGDKSLCGWRHGSVDDVVGRLSDLNRRGAGIFVTVNQTDGEGRKSENVTGLRALFVDDDNGQDIRCMVEPSIRVQSRRGQQLYWVLEDGEPLDLFRPAQLALAHHFGTDPSVTDLPRVMRAPGSKHVKAEPFPVRILGVSEFGPYTIRGLLSDLGIDADLDRRVKKAVSVVVPATYGHVETTRYGSAALGSAVALLAGQREGGRHKAIFASAAAMGELVAGGQLEESEAITALVDAAVVASSNGDREIPNEEIEKAIKEGMAKGKASPRAPVATAKPDYPPPHTDEDAPPPWEEPAWVHADDSFSPEEHKETKKHSRLQAVSQAEGLRMWRSSAQRQSIPTGISSLDVAIGGGLPVGQVAILLGYTGTGKSELCRQIRNRVAGSGTSVVHVDVELGASRIIERDLAQASGVPVINLRSGDHSQYELEAVRLGEEKLVSQTKIKTISPGGGVPLDLLAASIDVALNDGDAGPKLLILDSMQRLSTGAKADSLRLQVQEFSNWCCSYAQTRNVAILMTGEQHRDQKGGRPGASDALTSGAESRSIEFQSDILMALVPKETQENEFAGPCDEHRERRVDLIVAKNRHGTPGYIQSTLVFVAPCWDLRVEGRGKGELTSEVIGALTSETQNIREILSRIHRRKTSVLSVLSELVADGRAKVEYAGTKKAGWKLGLVSTCNHSTGLVPKPGTKTNSVGSAKVGTLGNQEFLKKCNGTKVHTKSEQILVPGGPEPIFAGLGSHRGGMYIPPGDRTQSDNGPIVIQRNPGDDDD